MATLLIAMGVGVLIGHDSGAASGKAAGTSTQIIRLGGTGGAAAANTSTAAAGNSSTGGASSKSSSSKSGKAKSGKAPPPKVVVQQAQQAASKVTGGDANVAGATVTQGGRARRARPGARTAS